jgi:uncharacterized membrane protein YphA (DoxX/SURF4 family)
MLSLFPSLLFLAPFAALFIRVAVAIALVLASWKQMSEGGAVARTLGVLEFVAAAALFVGFWTQAAALLAILLFVAMLLIPNRPYPESTLLLALVMALTLVVTGPGAFAFDLPL